ncbi:hypothetical protein [Moritella viscosa]|uniref:hypothetical protein n=1 Tax=Moritella viscosa TaxID=80854 RepID=UPI00094D2693|nr:hypothetical protein [Moritella viscosa]
MAKLHSITKDEKDKLKATLIPIDYLIMDITTVLTLLTHLESNDSFSNDINGTIVHIFNVMHRALEACGDIECNVKEYIDG